MPPVKRRDFLVGATITGLATACADEETVGDVPALPPEQTPPPRIDEGPPRVLPDPVDPSKDPDALPTRPFGKSGVNVTLLGLGGMFTVAEGTKEAAIAIVQRAYAKGVRFFDTAWIYGASQGNIGEALEKERKNVFLQTKTMMRDYDGAMRQLEESLKALRTDYLDSWLIHDMRHQNEVDQVLGKGGALEAMQKAKDQGVVRAIGTSGHSWPDIIKQLVDTKALDCVMIAINAAETFEKPFAPILLPPALEQNLGVIAFKTVGYGNLLPTLTMQECLGWSLSQKVSVVLVGASFMKEVDENADIARNFVQLDAAAITAIEEKAKPVAYASTFFRRGGHASPNP